jgi:hypothetical protein
MITTFVAYLLFTFKSLQIDPQKIQEAASSQVIKINTMEVNKSIRSSEPSD